MTYAIEDIKTGTPYFTCYDEATANKIFAELKEKFPDVYMEFRLISYTLN